MFSVGRSDVHWLDESETRELFGFTSDLQDWADAHCPPETKSERAANESLKSKPRALWTKEDEAMAHESMRRTEAHFHCQEDLLFTMRREAAQKFFRQDGNE
jgi:hypothetical protein